MKNRLGNRHHNRHHGLRRKTPASASGGRARRDYGKIFAQTAALLWLCYSANLLNALPAGPTICVIANPHVEVDALSKTSLRSIFGMRNRTWPKGDFIRVFVLEDKNPTHILFTKQILRTFPYNLRRIWDRRIYSGTGQSPTVVDSEEEMRRQVSLTDNAIGYLSNKWVNDDVKVLDLK